MGPANPLPSASFLMAEGVIGFNGKLDTVGDVVVGAGVLGSAWEGCLWSGVPLGSLVRERSCIAAT